MGVLFNAYITMIQGTKDIIEKDNGDLTFIFDDEDKKLVFLREQDRIRRAIKPNIMKKMD